jgi:hypothetical protein
MLLVLLAILLAAPVPASRLETIQWDTFLRWTVERKVELSHSVEIVDGPRGAGLFAKRPLNVSTRLYITHLL